MQTKTGVDLEWIDSLAKPYWWKEGVLGPLKVLLHIHIFLKPLNVLSVETKQEQQGGTAFPLRVIFSHEQE